jgi:vesicle-fusing ATPase
MIVEMSDDLRSALDGIMTDRDYERVDQTPEDFLSRIACRILLFPSGATLLQNLQSPPGAMVYGKLLYGGVTRYRILGNTANANRAKRKAGERTVIAPPRTGDETVPTESWLQYGGPERCYSALDIGPCAVMEITILPKGLRMDSLRHASTQTVSSQLEEIPLEPVFRSEYQDMVAIQATMCDPRFLFDFPVASTNTTKNAAMQAQNVTPSHAENSCTIVDVKTRFSTTLGGLQPQIDSIIRRVLNGRVNPDTSERSTELQTLLDLGLSPVKGLLLYGLPGCGKTALARELSRLLTERPPKIVSAPELMDRWVGGTERLVRDLFQEAEEELRLCNGDVTKSGLHVVVIDEVDAVFRKRSASSGSGEVARASAVNQILAKMDGVNQLGNVLVIGTTNRRELLDEALLRPGRLEVQIHVPLPDREGRREILQLYFAPLRQQGRLSRPLCRAIDGQNTQHFTNDDVGSDKSWRNRLRRLPSISWAPRPGSIHDLAADRWTGGFSGADLEGLVRNAGSLALSRARKEGSGVDGLLITLEDVRRALQEATN